MKKSTCCLRVMLLGLSVTLIVFVILIRKAGQTSSEEVALRHLSTHALNREDRGELSIESILAQDWGELVRRAPASGPLSQKEVIRLLEKRVQEARRELDGTAAGNDSDKTENEQDDGDEDNDDRDSAARPPASLCRQQNNAEMSHSLEGERARRRVEYMSHTMWKYASASLRHLRSRATGNATLINAIAGIQSRMQALQNTLAYDFLTLRRADRGEDWRKTESKRLGALVQSRLTALQNPSNCSQARFVVCNLKQACGFGCLLHHVCYCLLVAYATQRTLLLQEGSLLYGQHKWESVFKPLSKTCQTAPGPVVRWGDNTTDWESAQSLFLPLISQLSPRPRYLPMAIPEDLAPRLKVFHGDPAVWWIGQLLAYLTRPNYKIRPHIDNTAKKLGFQGPIVGVHIRRTDKLVKEASFHSLEEYMSHVDDYFRELEHHKSPKRHVYLATDDPGVLAEARKKYPKYVFIANKNTSHLASTEERNSYPALVAIILDTYFLSRSDFLVCTFSSNVCRAVYALKQTYDGDASNKVRSLDKRFYFNGQREDTVWAVEKHTAESNGQVSFEAGDMLRLQGNDLSRLMSRGLNLRTGKSGMFPTYKTVREIVEVKMPTYPDIVEGN